MKECRIQIIAAYAYHAIFIILGFIMVQGYPDTFSDISFFGDILYYISMIPFLQLLFWVNILYLIYWIAQIIYWVCKGKKWRISWMVYLHFAIGTTIETLLNCFKIIPHIDFEKLYIFLLFLHVIALGIVNLIFGIVYFILRLIRKQRHK